MRLVVTALAALHIEEASEWWYANRPAARGLFRTELRRAYDLLLEFPQAGPVTTSTRTPGVRRVLLPLTRYHVYYQIRENAIEILELWHASRGSGPDV